MATGDPGSRAPPGYVPCLGRLDVLTVSCRLGHGAPVVTLTTYAHLFEKTDSAAVKAIEAALGTGAER